MSKDYVAVAKNRIRIFSVFLVDVTVKLHIDSISLRDQFTVQNPVNVWGRKASFRSLSSSKALNLQLKTALSCLVVVRGPAINTSSGPSWVIHISFKKKS